MAELGEVRIVTIPGCVPRMDITDTDDVTIYVPWDCSDERRAQMERDLRPEFQAEMEAWEPIHAMAAAIARSAEETKIRLALECFTGGVSDA